MRGLLFLNQMHPSDRMSSPVARAGIEYGAPVHASVWPAGRASTSKRDVRDDSDGLFLKGYATRYGRVHAFKGHYEVFRAGVFAKSLLDGSTIRLLGGHDEAVCVATTNGGGLELTSDNVGLAFGVRLPSLKAARELFDEVKSGRMRGMSVGYDVLEYFDETIEGVNVRIITAARLSEISVVERGAVADAYVEVATDSSPPQCNSLEANTNGAYARMMSAMAKVRDALP